MQLAENEKQSCLAWEGTNPQEWEAMVSHLGAESVWGTSLGWRGLTPVGLVGSLQEPQSDPNAAHKQA